MTDKEFSLADGSKVPSIGFGPGILEWYANYNRPLNNRFADFYRRIINRCYRHPKAKRDFIDSIINAINIGYSLIDYATAYGNTALIGEAWHKSGIKREKLLLTTRITNRAQFNNTQRDEVLRCIEAFKTDYIDIVQIHFPVPDKFLHTWELMLKMQQEGYIRFPSVANCNIHHLQEIISASTIVPLINQIEVHPLFSQKPLIDFCKSKNILVEAYTPTARFDDRLTRLPALKRICVAHNKSVGQVILRWHIQNGIIPVVRALNLAHQKSNIDIYDFELTDEDMRIIDGFNINSRLRFDPDNCDFTIL